MRLIRTIVAFLIAVSVAVLPVAGSAALLSKSVESGAAAAMAVSDDGTSAMDDCCPDPGAPCGQNNIDCPKMAVCAAQAVSIAPVTISQLIDPASRATPLPKVANQVVPPPNDGSPPFRPPRI